MQSKQESVLVIYEGKGIVGIVHRDASTGHQVIHRVEEMHVDEIAELIGKEKIPQ